MEAARIAQLILISFWQANTCKNRMVPAIMTICLSYLSWILTNFAVEEVE